MVVSAAINTCSIKILIKEGLFKENPRNIILEHLHLSFTFSLVAINIIGVLQANMRQRLGSLALENGSTFTIAFCFSR